MRQKNLKRIIAYVCIFLFIAVVVEVNMLAFYNRKTLYLTLQVVWNIIAGVVILFALIKLANANDKISSQMTVFSSLSEIYYSMHLIDMSDYTIEKLESNELMDQIVNEGKNAADMLERIVRLSLEKEYVDQALSFVDLTTLKDRLKNKKSIFMDVVNKNVGWLRMSFITVEADSDGVPTKVIIATQVIDENKKREEELSNKAHKDELTGLFNRRAYENDLLTYPDIPPEADFVYAAIDVNGLKYVNDNIGHAAGDEILKAAAKCILKTLGNYGRVYRTGGDEFVSMFFADEEHLQNVASDLEKMTGEWKGELVDHLSLSVGYVTKREFENETVVNMSKIADRRMYQAKARYYSQKGIDRRGQAAAHRALCSLYTKILKINLTDDTFTIVNADNDEITEERGYSDRISEWLHNFGVSGQVHPDDLSMYLEYTDSSYLKEYFKKGKTSIFIHYRRKTGENYTSVVMEMIPADDYSNDNQSLFLYVKEME